MNDAVLDPSAIVADLGATTAADYVQRVSDRITSILPMLSTDSDQSTLSELAHTNKSVAAAVGADRLASTLGRLEARARADASQVVASAIAECQQAAIDFLAAVPEVLTHLRGQEQP